MTRYAAENYSLREENRHLRSLDSVRRSEEDADQAALELEEALELALEGSKPTEGNHPPSPQSRAGQNVDIILDIVLYFGYRNIMISDKCSLFLVLKAAL